MVRIRGLSKRYGDVSVIEDLDLDIAAGEHLAVIGPSGSGKTTFLRVLMTLERPDSGTIEIEGEDLWLMKRNGALIPANPAHLRRVRAKVGMVFQHFNLFPHMTALRNVTEAPIHVLGLSRAQAAQRGVELLAKVGLEDKLDSYPHQLSGGQKQRVAIARALAMQPKVMLFDEVTSALDPELVGEVLGVLRQIARETEMTMIVVTHLMEFAREIANRVIFFDRGRVREDAPPDEIFTNPSHPRTREFLRAVQLTA
ncbi:MAG: ectoine/hydroxyectoine ABC transporter ATP-binding protein EhuA [Candidatus Omnitrophica bacterium]|nr:ectoine/hydroxyectoine ABC transporter ATP-binding protein EhuA [Candidatus Omnitrophota bacterium]